MLIFNLFQSFCPNPAIEFDVVVAKIFKKLGFEGVSPPFLTQFIDFLKESKSCYNCYKMMKKTMHAKEDQTVTSCNKISKHGQFVTICYKFLQVVTNFVTGFFTVYHIDFKHCNKCNKI